MLIMETRVLRVLLGKQESLHLKLNVASVERSEKQHKPHAEGQPSTQLGSHAATTGLRKHTGKSAAKLPFQMQFLQVMHC